MKKLISAFLTAIVLSSPVYANTYKLPDGSVQGLPQNLIVMDENGHSPENGELYIYIDNMLPGELYTKDVTLMNARDDAVYSIFMTAEPNYDEGDIDLLNETECKLYLDDKLIYQGLVNGDGMPNMQQEGLDLGGVYKSGETRNLHAEFKWNITDETQKFIDEYSSEDKDFYGIVSFNWTFYAQIDIQGTNITGGGGGGGGGGSSTSGGSSDKAQIPPYIPTVPTEPHNPQNPIDPINPDVPHSPEPTSENMSEDTDSTDENISTIINHLIETIVDKTPFIPEDVKTGYHSEVVMYTKIAVAAFGAAVIILIIILFKVRKLKSLKKSS